MPKLTMLCGFPGVGGGPADCGADQFRYCDSEEMRSKKPGKMGIWNVSCGSAGGCGDETIYSSGFRPGRYGIEAHGD